LSSPSAGLCLSFHPLLIIVCFAANLQIKIELSAFLDLYMQKQLLLTSFLLNFSIFVEVKGLDYLIFLSALIISTERIAAHREKITTGMVTETRNKCGWFLSYIVPIMACGFPFGNKLTEQLWLNA